MWNGTAGGVEVFEPAAIAVGLLTAAVVLALVGIGSCVNTGLSDTGILVGVLIFCGISDGVGETGISAIGLTSPSTSGTTGTGVAIRGTEVLVEPFSSFTACSSVPCISGWVDESGTGVDSGGWYSAAMDSYSSSSVLYEMSSDAIGHTVSNSPHRNNTTSVRVTIFLFFCLFTTSLHLKSTHHSGVRSQFLRLLASFQPVVQQFEYDLFHLLGRVGTGKVLLKRVIAQRD